MQRFLMRTGTDYAAGEANDQQVEPEAIHRGSARGSKYHRGKNIRSRLRNSNRVDAGSSAARTKNQQSVQPTKATHNKVLNVQENEIGSKAKHRAGPRPARKHQVAAAIY